MSDLNAEARGLLSAARRSGSTIDSARKARVRRAMLATAGISSTAAFSLGKVVLVGAISATIGSGATLAVTQWQAQRRATSVPAQVSPPPPSPSIPAPSIPPAAPPTMVEAREPTPAPAVAPQRRKSAPPAQVENAPVPEEAPAIAEAPPSPVAEQPAPLKVPDESELALELELLHQALAAITAQRWVDAQGTLDTHRVRFPHAALPSEAGALQVMVWCAGGRLEEAKSLARELRRRDPLNPAVQRLSSGCAGK